MIHNITNLWFAHQPFPYHTNIIANHMNTYCNQVRCAGCGPLRLDLVPELQDLAGGQAEEAQRAQGGGGQPERAADDHRGLLPHLQQPQDLPQHARDHRHQGDLYLQVRLIFIRIRFFSFVVLQEGRNEFVIATKDFQNLQN